LADAALPVNGYFPHDNSSYGVCLRGYPPKAKDVPFSELGINHLILKKLHLYILSGNYRRKV
ncbi:MAG: hypothetical protein V3571_10395, partial [Pseudodesulfovibrio sp.]